MTAFSSLTTLPASQLANLDVLGYTQMTPIQAASLPAILGGKDVLAQAQTGSGKTVAFGLGVVHCIDPARHAIQALVLCPTRELAGQVCDVLRKLARFRQNIRVLALCGGQSVSAQRDGLHHPPHIVVGTTGRILDHLRRNSLQLNQLRILVLDEADRLLDMGFREDIDDITRQIPAQRQTLLFSATWPPEMVQMSQHIQQRPQTVTTDDASEPLAIRHWCYEVGETEKPQVLVNLLTTLQPASAIVFCNTRRACDDVAGALEQHHIDALALHGELDQRERDLILTRFANGSSRVLVATDVMARGVDIQRLALVINYQLAFEPQVHVHRIGRTGRAGQEGSAVSLVTGAEMIRAHALEDFLQAPLEWQDVRTLSVTAPQPLPAEMATLYIDGGRKAKIRPGDILGALTAEAGLSADEVGKITLTATYACVAVQHDRIRQAVKLLQQGKIKGKNCRVRWLK